jgi:predicted N-acetyltransferase YhbS
MPDEFRLARTDELAAVFDLRARAFRRGTVGDWAAGHDRDPWRDDGADLVAVSGGRVVATLRVLARRIASEESEVRLAGFASVASDPNVRQLGYVRRLLALAHERNHATGYDLAMLFTRSPWVYSGSAGFSILPFWWLDADLRRLPKPAGHWTIEPADPSRHLAGMRHAYDQFGRDRPGYPLRGEAYWSHPARLADPSWTRVALDRHGQVAAYLRVRLSPEGPATLLECPYLAADAVFALAAECPSDPAFARVNGLGGRLPRDHALGPAGAWRVADHAMVHRYTPTGGQLLEALRDATNRRSVYWYGDGF